MEKTYTRIVITLLIFSVISIIYTTNGVGAPPALSGNVAPDISNIDVGNITDTSAKITFTVDQEDAKTMIDYGTNVLLGKIDWNNHTGLTRIIILSGLSKNTDYLYRIYAYNGSDQTQFSRSRILNFKTVDSIDANATAPEISNIKVEGITDSTANISFSVNQTDANTIINYGPTQSLGIDSYWNNDTRLTRTIMLSNLLNGTIYHYKVFAYNGSDPNYHSNSGIDSFTTKINITPTPTPNATFGTGNRIWEEGANTNYIWNSYSFAGFYYDLDNNISTEELVIKNIKRTINKGDITYTTSPIEVNFEHSSFGSYQIIGFMADKYFGGYTGNSAVSSDKEISVIGRGQLQKILIDDDNRRTVSEGSTITLEEGYVLKMKEVDIGAGTGQILVSLLKGGGEVDSSVVVAGSDYIYTKRVGSIDLPIIAIHFDTVFRGRETNAAFIKGIFQVSDTYTSLSGGNRYDKMEISEVTKDEIVMVNRETIDLSPGNKVNLMGNLKIIVANDDAKLRFALSVERTGEFEARGTIYPITNRWTSMNFGLNVGNKNVGFYYDLDEDIGTENLVIFNIKGESIPTGGLVYSTSPQLVSFGYSNFGKYQVIGFMADKYFAGYTAKDTNLPNPTASIGDKSVIAQGQLDKILIDDDDKRTISVGSTITLKEGYVLMAKDIDMGARTMLLSLLKDGTEVDSTPLSAGQTYVYTKKVGSVAALPLIIVRFDSVFSGTETQAAFIKGIFQISEDITSVKIGDTYGKMEVSSIAANEIKMDNKNTISLSAGSTIDLMGSIKFKVADSKDLRFYPFVLVTQDMINNQLNINTISKATAGDTISLNVTAGGVPIEGVSITIEPEIGSTGNNTNKDGILEFTFPITSQGTYNITASKLGYQKASKNIDIAKSNKKLSIDTPTIADQFRTISIKITYNSTAISGATIIFDNNTIGTTNNSGILNYKLESNGIHTISASKSGYITTSREINIRAPYSEFKAQDINIVPNKTFKNDKVYIRSNITNVGTKSDTNSIDLVINGSIVNNKSITIDPDGIQEINFTYEASVPEGNYTVQILEQKGLLEVKKTPLNIVMIGTIITIIGAIIIYIITTRGNKEGDKI